MVGLTHTYRKEDKGEENEKGTKSIVGIEICTVTINVL